MAIIDIGEHSAEKIKLTEDVLNSISWHLKGKSACRGKVYRVAIGVYDCEQAVCVKYFHRTDYLNSIFFETNVKLRGHNGFKTFSPAIQHIIIEHFYKELFAGCANGNQVQIYQGKLVLGVYEYQLSTTGKYRRWVKISSNDNKTTKTKLL